MLDGVTYCYPENITCVNKFLSYVCHYVYVDQTKCKANLSFPFWGRFRKQNLVPCKGSFS